ncbi:MAG: peptide deformylase [Parcubacteria group bacterium Gr01-1014_33]|nr:MAG: peptide deformylase [Parcubacteria group bacterium Gr01-1014_33]
MQNTLPIVKEPNSVLRGRAQEVDAKDITAKRIQALIADMRATLKNTPDGVGLAAPQVGESLRIFIVSDEAEEIDKTERRRWKEGEQGWERNQEKPYEIREWRYFVFINPEVKNTSKASLEDVEGCLSVPGKFGIVKRYEKITVSAYDENGKKFMRGASRFFARVLQHEFDHLEGVLFVDRTEQFINVAPREENGVSPK